MPDNATGAVRARVVAGAVVSARVWPQGDLVGVGEMMAELAPVANGLYALGFAGDTLNTSWYLKRMLGARARVGYLTRIGGDLLSAQALDFLVNSGLETERISRDAERTLGLYLIHLQGAERQFSYWRGQSAARRMADDPSALIEALRGAALIHVSGITLAIIEATGRHHLLDALAKARAAGAIVSFDPNVRPRLWPDRGELRAAMIEMFANCDIALPSFDDETLLWGDASPSATVERIAASGVVEIIVKNGASPALVFASGSSATIPASASTEVRDTTGAGDAFNAGYLSARRLGVEPNESCRLAHRLAAEVIRHPGALAPPHALVSLQQEFERL